MKTIKVFFDCEFTGLHQNTKLISIGLIADTEKQPNIFYAESADGIAEALNDPWLERNVCTKLSPLDLQLVMSSDPKYTLVLSPGDNILIKNKLKDWLDEVSNNGEYHIQLYADVAHYDMILFQEIFGGAFGVPSYVSAYVHDINTDISCYLNNEEWEAFDVSRESLLEEWDKREIMKILNGISEFTDDMKRQHNALYDAVMELFVYMAIYRKAKK